MLACDSELVVGAGESPPASGEGSVVLPAGDLV